MANEQEIPQGADRAGFLTSSEDFLWRKRFLVEKAHHFDVFFRKQLDLLLQLVLIPVFGVTDYIIRYEYQSRGAIHAHLMLLIPMGVSEMERRLAWRNLGSSDEFVEDWHCQLADELANHQPPVNPLTFHQGDDATMAEKQALIRLKLLLQFAHGCGGVERHPSNLPDNWFVNHGGRLATAPSADCLRQEWDTTLANPFPTLVNLVNKVATHTCSESYCKKPERRRVVVDGAERVEETPRECRFGYPRPLLGFKARHSEDDDTLLATDPTDKPVADGWIGRTEQGWPVLRVRRNHPRVTAHNPYLLLGLACNLDLQLVPTLLHMLNYVTKYISKGEPMSGPSTEFLKEAVNRLPPGGEVRKVYQRLLMTTTKDHDYSLPEVHLYISQENAIKFSRDQVVLPVLNSGVLNLGAGTQDQPVVRQPLGLKYDARYDNDNFKALITTYEEHQAAGNLENCVIAKHPSLFSLYEFCSCFTDKWEPLDRFKSVHIVPHFKARPDEQSSPEWFKKFLVCWIRAHFVPGVLPLEDLEAMTSEELLNYGNPFFDSDLAANWINQRWYGHSDLYSVEDIVPFFRPDDQQHEDDEHRVVGDGLQEDVEDEDPAEGGELYQETDATEDFDKSEDRLAMCPDWDHGSSMQFRARVKLAAYDNAANPAALRHDQLNAKQALLVDYLVRGTRRLLHEVKEGQFFLEVCGSASTGKTTALLRYLEDVRIYYKTIRLSQLANSCSFQQPQAQPPSCCPSQMPRSTVHFTCPLAWPKIPHCSHCQRRPSALFKTSSTSSKCSSLTRKSSSAAVSSTTFT